ncbi:MAG: sugar phosphate nucleotidyltransferase, partial [Colwellia sp.]
MLKSIILAGGSGTRLWPLSRKGSPKQFVSIGGAPSLFQSTLQRALNITNSVSVVAAESHQFMVKGELEGQVNNASVMLE